MKKIIFVLVTCMFFLNVAQAVVVWSDNMEYADQAALQTVWPANPFDPYYIAPAGTNAASLSTGQNHTLAGSKSAAASNAYQFSEHYFGQTNKGSIEVWFYDPLTTTTGNIFGLAEVVRGTGFSLFGVMSAVSGTNYVYRTDLNNWTVTGIERSQGWHQIIFTFGDYVVAPGTGGSIYFDGQHIVDNETMWHGIWSLEFGNKYQFDSGETFYFDDVKLHSEIIPEPATLLLLSFGGSVLFARRRRA